MSPKAMANHTAVLCLLLLAGRLAAASKTFGGYGGETGGGGQQQPAYETMPLFPPSMADAAKALTGTATGGGDAYSTPSEPAPSTPAAESTAPKDESYGTLTPTTPTTPTPAKQEGSPVYGAQSQAQPSAEGSASSGSGSAEGSASASAEGAGAQGGYGSSATSSPEASDEPKNGLNEKAINDIVNEHNVFRAKEHVPPLTWNATLAAFSQKYAEQLKGECKMVHSTSPYGENLMLGSGAISWKTTVDTWSDEKKSYHYGSNTCDPGQMCGHYTAVVWKNTTSVGCGRVLCNNGDTMIVCSYWPPGNYDNVKPY